MIRQYSQEEYKEMIQEFCKINAAAKQALDKEEAWKSDMFSMSRNELIDFVIYGLCGRPKSIKYMLNQKNKLSLFLDWCVSEGSISVNPLKAEAFDDEAFLFRCMDAMEITVFYDTMVEDVISRLTLNRTVYELLIRGFYEGIRDVKDFLLLRYRDIDYGAHTICVNGHKRNMSEDFFRALARYRDCDVLDSCCVRKEYSAPGTGRITQRRLYQYEDYVLKASDTKGLTRELYVKRMSPIVNRYFKRISEDAGYYVAPDMLYLSGFVNYVKEVCDREKRPADYYIKLFYVRANDRGYTRIMDLAVEYGLRQDASTALEIRRVCLPYIVKGKYYR